MADTEKIPNIPCNYCKDIFNDIRREHPQYSKQQICVTAIGILGATADLLEKSSDEVKCGDRICFPLMKASEGLHKI
jgi:hypothetical protein